MSKQDTQEPPIRNEWLQPPDLFDRQTEPTAWTCVRLRPQSEKSFARWLAVNGFSFFLPLVEHEAVSHRKRRRHWLPLFPGYVFVKGRHYRETLHRHSAIIDLSCPDEAMAGRQLHHELNDIFRAIQSDRRLELIQHQPVPGDRVHLLSGPLKGVEAICVKQDGADCIMLSIELLGVAAAMDLPPDWMIAPVS